MPSTGLTLYQIEEGLAALLDTEELVPVEQETVFRQDLARQLKTAVEKRDAVAQFLRFLDLQADNCDAEIKRLQARKKRLQNAYQRVRGYVQYVLESMGTDERGQTRKLEGATVTFALRENSPKLNITNEADIPDRFRDVSLVLPLVIWQDVLLVFKGTAKSAFLQAAMTNGDVTVNKQRLLEALKEGATVPGCHLKSDVSLVMR